MNAILDAHGLLFPVRDYDYNKNISIQNMASNMFCCNNAIIPTETL